MFSKPFKPLTIRKTAETNDLTRELPAKRRKLSPPDVPTLASQRQPLVNAAADDKGGSRRPLNPIHNPPSPDETAKPREGKGFENYYSVLWRIPTNKKNKTWTDDGLLVVSGGYASLYNNTGKNIGRAAFAYPLLPGSNLSVGGKEIEVDACISRDEYLAAVRLGGSSGKQIQQNASKSDDPGLLAPQPSKLSLRDQMKAEIQREKAEKPKGTRSELALPRTSIFKQPLKETTVLPQVSKEKPIPRHDPNAAGSLVFKRPHRVPAGRQVVDVVLDPAVGQHLRPHQREGVKFLYECVMGLRDFNGQGCILADDMGLGKTLTTIALLWTLLRQNPIHKKSPVVKRALIVCPVSLIRNWKREFRKWLGLDRLGVLEFEDQNTSLNSFDGRVYQVMIIGYERLRTVADDLASGPPIDIVICDEGHRLKTMKNKSSQAIESLNTPRRIILSGTPIQNDLGEFYAMVNFVNDGCLGSQKGFSKDFENPIMKSRQPNASDEDIERGQDASNELANATAQFILRRTADILADFLPPKTEFVLFCKPTPAQAKIYKSVLHSSMFDTALRSNETAFQLITILKKLCNSPALMDPKYGNDDATPSASLTTLNEMLPAGLSKLYHNSVSSKIRLLDCLLQEIHSATDEKVVIVSNYTSTLNLIEQLLSSTGLTYLRLDGSVAAKKRQGLVDQFNRSKSSQSFAFLLSAKAGGVGLNLIGASRLVLFDVDWNPATDDQAIARIHRQGQQRHCKIYRFLIKGSLEERIWQRQAVKRALADSIMQAGTAVSSGANDGGKKGKSSTSTFSQAELRDLFRLDENEGLRTHELIRCGCEGTRGNCNAQEESYLPQDGAKHEKRMQDLMDSFDDELPEISDLPSIDRCSRKKWTGASTPVKTGLEAERQELMKYSHLNTSVLWSGDTSPDVTSRLLEMVEDACLEKTLGIDQKTIGGGGVAYLFKKTKGSQLFRAEGAEV
ncbi:uncharacterized protein A1O9_07210 [Exophiala aquamarina CBS 119918]|uniref:DNA repair and recombination protein RAD54B n=1 Tax=Exophiala aquamarina CBS 119918 TaxID=1182545 RepID=A0A072PNA4_9EURO|nr:uncharacterized protein A1O9_07210 [Exophiala aquamarina CBS 119918]KEF57020.1 hypothetical protein A1O9_07210 [Exophiala aquamarina CBS 119918]